MGEINYMVLLERTHAFEVNKSWNWRLPSRKISLDLSLSVALQSEAMAAVSSEGWWPDPMQEIRGQLFLLFGVFLPASWKEYHYSIYKYRTTYSGGCCCGLYWGPFAGFKGKLYQTWAVPGARMATPLPKSRSEPQLFGCKNPRLMLLSALLKERYHVWTQKQWNLWACKRKKTLLAETARNPSTLWGQTQRSNVPTFQMGCVYSNSRSRGLWWYTTLIILWAVITMGLTKFWTSSIMRSDNFFWFQDKGRLWNLTEHLTIMGSIRKKREEPARRWRL